MFCGIVNAHGKGVQQKVDSLTGLLASNNDSVRVKLYLKLFKTTYNTDPNRALYYGKQAYKLSSKLGQKRLAAGSLMNLGSVNIKLGNKEQAIANLEEAQQMFEALKDSLGLAMCLGNIADYYARNSRLVHALAYTQKAMQISKQINDSVGIAIYMEKLANNYTMTGPVDSAFYYYSESLELFKSLNMVEARAIGLSNLGLLFSEYELYELGWQCYEEALQISIELGAVPDQARLHCYMGRSLLARQQWGASKEHFNNSLRLLDSIGLFPGQIQAWNGIAAVLKEQGKYKEALEYYQHVLSLKAQEPNLNSIARTHSETGELFHLLQMEDSAAFHFEAALTLSREMNLLRSEHIVVKQLVEYYRDLGDQALVQVHQQRDKELTDSLFRSSDFAAIERLQAKFKSNQIRLLQKDIEFEKQKYKLELARNDIQEMLVIVLALAFGLLAMIFIWFRAWNKTVFRGKILEEREKGLRTMIEAENQNREKLSRDLHDGVGQILNALRMNIHQLWPEKNGTAIGEKINSNLSCLDGMIGNAMKEVRTISYLMMPRILEESGLVAALNEMLTISVTPAPIEWEFDPVNVKDRLPGEIEINLYRVCQELVSNTLKHSQATAVQIQLVCTNDQVLLTLEDDGIGFDYAKSMSAGMGLRNMKNRVEVLGGKLVVEQLSPQGQITKIRIPHTT